MHCREGGGTILVPAGLYSSTTPTAFRGLVVTKPMTLEGETREGNLLSKIHNVTNAKNIDAFASAEC